MPNRSFATALASALADLGVEHACMSPGSRNTPLIAGFAAEPRIRKWSLIDERSAGFFALGLAKATGRPVVLACTSGTAAVEYHAAVVEASQSDVPLLVLTADRPEELRGIGAPQTIDQVSLYGTAVRMFADAHAPDPTTAPDAAADIAIDVWAHATASPPGPVHLNLPFREPLLEPSPPVDRQRIEQPPAESTPEPNLDDVAARLERRNGVIVAGRSNDPAFPAACSALATALGWPVFADPLSGLRFGNHPLGHVLGYGDQLAAIGALDQLHPEVVLRFGPVPTSKPVWTWLQSHAEIEQIVIDEQSRDATRSASLTLEIPAAEAAAAITAVCADTASESWLESWVELDEQVAKATALSLDAARFPNEPAIARTAAAAAPPDSILTVGSSMPIRDLDAFGGKASKPLLIVGNRGANGIDGVVSAALGTAAAGFNAIVLVGDVSLFHDLNSLGAAAQLHLPITIVVVNNNGGGIFHFLPQDDPAVLPSDVFESYLATPHDTDFVAVAQALGIEAHRVDDGAQLADLVATPIAEPRLIEIRTDRRDNLELHRRIAEDVLRHTAR